VYNFVTTTLIYHVTTNYLPVLL